MDKITVETTGAFMLTDPVSGHEIPVGQAVTVPHTHFITERLETKELREVAAKAPPAPPAPPARDPLDHDGDGHKGGSKPKSQRGGKA